MKYKYPRFLIAGLSGDAGKTFISCGLTRVLLEDGLSLGVFKKGPDYIDTAWLKLASGGEVRNLDTYLTGVRTVYNTFVENTYLKDISIIEGNRGLFDGLDKFGTHSTAELSKILRTPVILIIDATKVTRTVAALVYGCKFFDKKVNIAGVIINRYSGHRHLKIIKDSVESETGIPVVGSIPRLEGKVILPSRHLGLITPSEYKKAGIALETAKNVIADNVDVDLIKSIAQSAEVLDLQKGNKKGKNIKSTIKIGYFNDKIFSFYYPENLEDLISFGAELVSISSIKTKQLPEIDGLYIGGGFPESHISDLVKNESLMNDIKTKADKGIPIYAECGGLMYLSETIEYKNKINKLAGVLPLKIKMFDKPAGHGYTEAICDVENPFFKKGYRIRGHEFHYSKIVNETDLMSCMNMKKGAGSLNGRDGFCYKNVFASYFHIHSRGENNWAKNFTDLVKTQKK